MKKILSFLLALSMVLSCVPMPIQAEEVTCNHSYVDGICLACGEATPKENVTALSEEDAASSNPVEVNAPVINSVTVDKTRITAGESVTVTMDVTDESELAEVYVTFDTPNEGVANMSQVTLSLQEDGLYRGTLTTDTSFASGTYYAYYIVAEDVHGNRNQINTDRSVCFELLSELTETNAPVINSVSVDKTKIVAGESVTVTMDVTDESELAEVYVSFEMPFAGVVKRIDVPLSKEEDGLYRGTLTTDDTYPCGTYYAYYIVAEDIYGNREQINSDKSVCFEMISSGVETNAPVINSITLDKAQVVAGETVTITVDVTDESELTDVYVYFNTPLAAGSTLEIRVNLTLDENGLYRGTLATDESFANGNYHVSACIAKDVYGNYKQIQDKYACFELSGGYEDTTAPVITAIIIDKSEVMAGETVTITVDVTDESELTDVYVYFNTPLAAGSTLEIRVNLTLDENGLYRGTLATDESFANGNYHVSACIAKDVYGNYQQIQDKSACFELSGGHTETNQPVINSVTLDKSKVTAGETVTITADISDESDLSDVYVYFDTPLAAGSTLEICVNLILDEDGLYRGTLTTDESFANGNYYVSACIAKDVYGNYTQIQDKTACFEFGVSKIETNAPVIHSVAVDKSQVVIGESVTVTMEVTDESELDQLYVEFDTPHAGVVKRIHVDLTQDKDGLYRGTLTTDDTYPCGTYYAYYIVAQDVLGNRAQINSDTSLAFEVVSDTTSKGIAVDETNFPDANFRAWILAQDYGADGWLTPEELAAVGSIDVSEMGIADLTGIEHFTALQYLYCYKNQLTELDLSKNTALTDLTCYDNKLTSLNISQNTELRILNCSDNQLDKLDVSNNKLLIVLHCYNNRLTELDVSNNKELTSLICDYNQLSALDVTNNPQLETLWCDNNQLTELDLSNNPALTWVICRTNLLTELNVDNNLLLEELWCEDNQIAELNVSNNQALRVLRCFANELTALDVSNNHLLTTLWCTDNQIAGLDVSQNTKLEELYCDSNQLTALDVSNNTLLTQLQFQNNQLTTVDLTQNTALKILICHDNQLTELDVSSNTLLTTLNCSRNQLTSLNLSNNPDCTEVSADDNRREITLDDKNQFDLSTLSEFDVNKASNWTNGFVSSRILTATGGNITYSYQINNSESVSFTLRAINFNPELNLIEGQCGDYLTWCYDRTTRTLTIRGTGTMWDFEVDEAPWYAYSEEIQQLTVEEGVESIGKQALRDCSALADVSLPNGFLAIGEAAFLGCYSLGDINFPETLTTLADQAFYQCHKLENVFIPASVTSIGAVPFGLCGNLTELSVDPDNPSYCSEDNRVLFNKDKTVLHQMLCTVSGTYTVPDSVTAIHRLAFSYSSLKEIVLPDSVVEIGDCAFANCRSMESINIPNQVTRLENAVFTYCTTLKVITIPKSVKYLDNSIFACSDALSEIIFEGSAPEFSAKTFEEVTATAYYPANNSTWTDEVMQDYGGTITWVPYGDEHEHTEVIDAAVAPTCKTTGLTEGKHCSACGEVIVAQEVVPAKGHNVILMDSEEPTCELNGFEYYACEYCGGKEYTILIEATGHDYQDGTCNNCGCKDPNYVKPNKPSWDNMWDWIFGGWWGNQEKCDHSYISVVTAPTCTDKGYTTYTCSKCSDSYKDAYTNALGHTWDNGVLTEEPTCTKNGVKIYTCETCKNQKTETIKATGHDYEDGICGSCGAEEPAKPSEPSKPNKPGWIFDWIFGGWWK